MIFYLVQALLHSSADGEAVVGFSNSAPPMVPMFPSSSFASLSASNSSTKIPASLAQTTSQIRSSPYPLSQGGSPQVPSPSYPSTQGGSPQIPSPPYPSSQGGSPQNVSPTYSPAYSPTQASSSNIVSQTGSPANLGNLPLF